MPKYQNSTGADIVAQDSRFAANTITEIDYFLEVPLPTGLTKVSDEPMNALCIAGYLFQENSNGSVAYTLPNPTDGGYDIVIKCASGILEIRSDTNLTNIVFLGAGQCFRMRIDRRIFNVITVIARANSTVATVNFATTASLSN